MKQKYLLLILVLSCCKISFAQSVVSHGTSKSDPKDMQGWYGTTLNANLPKKWAAYLSYQTRFIDNLSYYNGSYITIGATKKVNKHLDFMADYRLSLVRDGVYHRFTVGTELSKKMNDLNFSFRFQIQNQLEEFDDTSIPSDNIGYWRARLQAKYAIDKRWEAYASFEPIMRFGGDYFVDNIRNTAGIKYKLNKDLKFDVFYIYRPDYAKSYNRLYHVFGFNADYTFKVKSRKKKK